MHYYSYNTFFIGQIVLPVSDINMPVFLVVIHSVDFQCDILYFGPVSSLKLALKDLVSKVVSVYVTKALLFNI